jgi:soluble lytic murein transglycosylase
MIAEERDAKLLLGVGKTAVQRGFSLDHHAYPTFGIPRFEPVDGSAEKAMVYAIARQESAFDAKAVSHANARGLMQMLPSTAARTARRFGLPFNPALLTSDPAANARLGAAHLGELMAEYGGSYVLTFAAYNAGDGRVREWINAYGDPRQPGTDVVDWVERIPFSETRNYVQRVMENLQVYRARLSGNRAALLIESDLRRGRP